MAEALQDVGSATARSPAGRQPKRESRKVRYTRQVIREVFLALLRELPVERITVSRICEMADISRGTFYLHYQDVYDLMESIENEFLQALEERITSSLAEMSSDYTTDPGFWMELLSWLIADRDLTRSFLSSPNSTLMAKCMQLNRTFSDELCRRQFPDMSQSERDYMHTFYEHGSASIIVLWVRNDFQEPPEQIAIMLADLNSRRKPAA